MIESFIKDLAVRAFHTFWQTFAAAVAVFWAGAGLHVSDLANLDALHKVATGVIAAAVAAGLSTLKTLTVNATTPSELGDVPAVDLTPVADDAPAPAEPVAAEPAPADPAPAA